MNDHRFLSGKVLPADERPKEAQSINVEFVDAGKAWSEYTKFETVFVQVAGNMNPEEELFVDYGEKYVFK